jgi:replication fork protection complex subunit Csm3/Swi3
MVEKAGHKKRVHTQEDALFREPELPPREEGGLGNPSQRIAPIFEKGASQRPKTPELDMDLEPDMHDLYDATPRTVRPRPTGENVTSVDSIFGGRSLPATSKSVVEEEPPEDELDALLAQEAEILQDKSSNAKSAPAAPQDDFDADEMEAMAEMDMEW